MALKEYLLSTITITILIGVSTVHAWDPDNHRYESYELERGPVFYEAYYPDSNEEPRGDYQEKRYFDRGAVLEKTYQVPSQRLSYPENAVRLENYRNRGESFGQGTQDNRFPGETGALDIKEISNLARRAISRDLENWNTLENYLDRAKYQDRPPRHRQIVVPEDGYSVQEPLRESSLPDPFKKERDPGKLYEVPADPSKGSFQPVDQRNVIRRLTTRDLAARDSLESIGAIRYRDQLPREQYGVGIRTNVGEASTGPIGDPYPVENIFAPRPQMINYIFSKKPVASLEDKTQSVSEAKVAAKESMPRNYGDNLIQEEIKKEQGKDVKVTSIEVSEVPRHKTRHHHGEWPKRDYSHLHQS